MLYKLLNCAEQRSHAKVISLMGGGALGARISDIGVPVVSLDMLRGGVPTPAAISKLRSATREAAPDILQGWMYHGNLAVTVAAALQPKRPLVVWNVRQSLYDLKNERSGTRWVIRANAWLSDWPNAIVYNSRVSAGQHEAFGFNASKTKIIPNGFDIQVFRPDRAARAAFRRELGLDGDSVLVGLIGRYHPMKDHHTFLRSAALISHRFPNTWFLLAGADVDDGNPVLSSAIAELGLGGRVLLLGERADIPALTASLDIACSSSWAEAFPNVLGEAMSCGIPCVVTDVGDSAWVLGEAGITVPPRNAEQFSKALGILLEMSAEERMALGDKGRRRIVERFSLKAVAREYRDLYDALKLGYRVSDL